MSQAIVAIAYGGPEALRLVDVDLPPPGPEQVTVEVRAAGVNPVDLKRYSGSMGSDTGALPMPLGFEVAGVVGAVGARARTAAGEPLRIGDEVIAFRIGGGYAQAVTVDAIACVPKPPAMGWAQAGGLMLAGTTAVHALTVVAVAAGETVLVHGVSGGVGLMIARLGRDLGATVIGTAGERHFAKLRREGVVPVPYGPGLAERVRDAAVGGIDACIDCAGTDEALDVSVAMADRARIVSIATSDATRGITLIGNGPGRDPGRELRDRARTTLTGLVEAGRLTVDVSRTFALADAARAHDFLTSGRADGKVVLLPETLRVPTSSEPEDRR